MKYLKMSFLAILPLITCVLNTCWQILLFLVDLIDGGDEDTENFPTDNNVRYNYRTGDIDPVKRLDGLYANKP
ncbi:hypothetical protein [Dasania marina]|uniref:hypothetical protein n=1 Tax=Dasania marina TaxID=471499 RepID=UPI0030DAE79A|tara:strand:- start:16382 stop:16600 length:219 start_codon:yes stop_codon:yes gene_type:complete